VYSGEPFGDKLLYIRSENLENAGSVASHDASAERHVDTCDRGDTVLVRLEESVLVLINYVTALSGAGRGRRAVPLRSSRLEMGGQTVCSSTECAGKEWSAYAW